MQPKISVLMSVYNSAQYLREAIQSILDQTLHDFEFLIINDSSTDESRNIILSFSDTRIKLIDNLENNGLSKSLNKGIEIAKAKYIARMDSDDISLPDRLLKQYLFMENNTHISVCGSWAKIIGADNYVLNYPSNNDEIKAYLLFNNPIIHPGTMFRKELFIKNNFWYDESISYSQDYELWQRASAKMNFANIPEVLLLYRLSPKSVEKKKYQESITGQIRKKQLEYLGLTPDPIELELHRSLAVVEPNLAFSKIKDIGDWINKIISVNSVSKKLDGSALKKILLKKYYEVCKTHTYYGPKVFYLLISHPFFNLTRLSNIEFLKFFNKCLIKWKKQ